MEIPVSLPISPLPPSQARGVGAVGDSDTESNFVNM